jgi:Fe-S-cluster containining protein
MPLPTSWLNFHVPYRCRHSLVCCSSGWPIPIERDRAETVVRQIAAGQVRPLVTPWLRPAAGAPDEMAGTLELDDVGRCVFLHARARVAKPVPPKLASESDAKLAAAEVGACTIHPHRPLSCAHFPYVCLIDQRGVHVTLSHYCPTAASLLFDHDGPIEIVEGPPPIPGLEIPEGLDARDSLPPRESAERLFAWDDFSRWEREQIARFQGSNVPGFQRSGVPGFQSSLTLFETARAAVPPPTTWPAIPDDLKRHWSALVAPAWQSFAAVIDRYLAAKLFASWAAYLGDGTQAILREVEIASAVLRVEATRNCLQAARPLDAALLKDAIRQSDLLLMHYADRARLSRS